MEFKPFDKVIVRANEGIWTALLYSHKIIASDNSIYHNAGGHSWSECIPFEGNEKLIGTTNPYVPKWEPKVGELILASNDNEIWFPVFFKNKMCELCKNIQYVCNCVLHSSNNYTCWKAYNYIKPFKQEDM